jgi:hypothetical protein
MSAAREVFLEDQSIHAVRVIAGKSAHNVVTMTLVKGESRDVIDRSFQFGRETTTGSQTLLSGIQQQRSNSVSSRRSKYIDCNDVTGSSVVRFGHDKSDSVAAIMLHRIVRPSCRTSLVCAYVHTLGDERERSGAAHISAEFGARIRNAGRKTGLVNAPKGLKIAGPKITNLESLNSTRHAPL